MKVEILEFMFPFEIEFFQLDKFKTSRIRTVSNDSCQQFRRRIGIFKKKVSHDDEHSYSNAWTFYGHGDGHRVNIEHSK